MLRGPRCHCVAPAAAALHPDSPASHAGDAGGEVAAAGRCHRLTKGQGECGRPLSHNTSSTHVTRRRGLESRHLTVLLHGCRVTLLCTQVEGLERNKLSGSELLSRIQLLENRVDAAKSVSSCTAISESDAADGSPGSNNNTAAAAACAVSTGAAPAGNAAGFSPFAQAKLVQQVAALEQQTTALLSSSAQLTFRTEQVLLPRLQECENRLAGVTNLAGSLMAVDAMAAEIGVEVPHPPLSALTALQGGGLGPDTQQQQQQQPQRVQSAQQQGSGNVLTVSRQQLLQQQIDDGRQQAAAMQQHLQHLQQQVGVSLGAQLLSLAHIVQHQILPAEHDQAAFSSVLSVVRN